MGAIVLEDVIDFVGEAPEAERGPFGISLCGVIVDNIENHLNARAMQRLDEITELVDGTERVLPGAVAGMGREKRARRVSPVIDQAQWTVLPVELEQRQQLDRGHP